MLRFFLLFVVKSKLLILFLENANVQLLDIL